MVLEYPGQVLCMWHSYVDFIANIHVTLLCDFKTKHFWPYTKYNNTCLNYDKPGWPKLSSPI